MDDRRDPSAAERREVAGLHRARRARRHAGGALASLKDPKFNYGFGRMWPQHGGRYHGWGRSRRKYSRHGPRRRLLRRTGYLDGEAAGYMPAVLPELGGNWIDHLPAWIKGERNHPSIMIWSVENELNFINARNLGSLDKWEPVLTRAWEAIQQVDPTRPMMVDGGGATREQTLPVHGDHYSTKPFWNYPQLAYEANADRASGPGTNSVPSSSARNCSPPGSIRPTPTSAASKSSWEKPATGPPWARPCR